MGLNRYNVVIISLIIMKFLNNVFYSNAIEVIRLIRRTTFIEETREK